MSYAEGSSPRMRGALHPGHGGWQGAGIIPAYAGSTATSTCVSVRMGDHPRVCGEHIDPSAVIRT